MSLATRCPNCNTVFQVNEEQLKRFSGVVRCGVCQSPFNGIDHLIGRLSHNGTNTSVLKAEDAFSSTPVPVETVRTSPAEVEKLSNENFISSDSGTSQEKIGADRHEITQDDAIKAREAALKASFEKQIQSINFDLNLPVSDEGTSVSPELHSGIPTPSDASNDQNTPINVPAEIERKEPFLSPESAKGSDTAEIIVPNSSRKTNEKAVSAEELVKFAQKNKKRFRFSSFLWGFGTFFLFILLGAQGIYRYSQEIITWWPPAEELVNTTCELLSCPIEAPVKKPPLSIEAGVPEKLENVPDQYTQNITITNNSQDLQVWPSLVLELTDSDNKVLLRRIFEPEEYLPEEAGTAKGLQPASGITFKMIFEFAHNPAVKSRVFLLDKPDHNNNI